MSKLPLGSMPHPAESDGASSEGTAARLRIALLSAHLPDIGRKSGGVGQVAHELASGLSRRGHEVTVWGFDPAPGGANYRVEVLPWRRFATSRIGRFLTEGYLGNLISLFPRYRDADVIVAMGDSLLLPLLRKPLIRVMHGSALGEALSARSPWRFVAQAGIYPQELLTALTQPGCVGVSRNTRRYNPFVRQIIPNGVDLSSFRPDAAEKTLEPSILFVGTLDGRKRGRLLLDRFVDEVRPRIPTARLTMVGVDGAAVPGVSYRSGISTADLAALYRQSWVYASPSAYEGFGLPYLEAMASGTPVLASPNPGSREVLEDGAYGVLAADPDFGSELISLLENAERREVLARRGLERASEYSLDRMLDGYENLLLRACGRAPAHTLSAPSSPAGGTVRGSS